MRPLFTWAVYGHEPRETLAVFFEHSDAVAFVSANRHNSPESEMTGFERRNLYIAPGKYDRRERGYRCSWHISEDQQSGRFAA